MDRLGKAEPSATVLALIPARCGSKTLPNKNIRDFFGKPLISHSIEHARNSTQVDRVIVSTDSEEYAAIAREYGADVPFIRPAELAQDHSTDWEVFDHALTWLNAHENFYPDICLHLRPTYPIRTVSDIDAVLQILKSQQFIDSVRSVVVAEHSPLKMWFKDGDGYLAPVVSTSYPEAYNLPRQLLPQAYIQNACIDAVRTRVIVQEKSMTGKKIFGYLMKNNFDIDTEEQFQRLVTQKRNS